MTSPQRKPKPHNLVYLHRDRGYRFVERDPDLDWIANAIDKSGMSVGDIIEAVLDASNGEVHISYATVYNWLSGKTRRPQNFTLTWVAYALGWERTWSESRSESPGLSERPGPG